METRLGLEDAFAILIALQFVLVVSHDWVDIPGWVTGSQVQAVVGRRKLAIATAINAIFPGVAVAFAIGYWRAEAPWFAADYWVVYCAVTLASAIAMWYVPYLWGTSEKQKREYAAMYAGTHHILPTRGDNPRPNLLHVGFHVLFLATLALALLLRFGSS